MLSKRKQVIADHFANASDYQRHAHVQSRICDLLIDKITQTHYRSILEMGAGNGQLTQKLINHITADHWHINELCQQHATGLQSIIPQARLHIGDAERLAPALSDPFHMVVSANTIQWFDNPLSVIAQSHHLLQKDGQLLFNTFTANNFYQIKQLTGQGLDYPSIEEWQNELEKHDFTIKEITPHRYHLAFSSPYEVLQHIKKTGVSVNNTQDRPAFFWNKTILSQFYQDYQKRFSDEKGQVILTYEALLIHAYK